MKAIPGMSGDVVNASEKATVTSEPSGRRACRSKSNGWNVGRPAASNRRMSARASSLANTIIDSPSRRSSDSRL
jgi:hypothetical protein